MPLDSYGNWTPDLHMAPVVLGTSTSCCPLTGVGAPDDSLGVDGNTYIDTSTGDFYVKANGVFVQSGGGAGSGQIKQYVANPNTESIVPSDLNSPAWAYAKNNDGPPFAWDTTLHVWMT